MGHSVDRTPEAVTSIQQLLNLQVRTGKVLVKWKGSQPLQLACRLKKGCPHVLTQTGLLCISCIRLLAVQLLEVGL